MQRRRRWARKRVAGRRESPVRSAGPARTNGNCRCCNNSRKLVKRFAHSQRVRAHFNLRCKSSQDLVRPISSVSISRFRHRFDQRFRGAMLGTPRDFVVILHHCIIITREKEKEREREKGIGYIIEILSRYIIRIVSASILYRSTDYKTLMMMIMFLDWSKWS